MEDEHFDPRIRRHDVIDHIKDALEAHNGWNVIKADSHRLVINNHEAGVVDQILVITMDVEEVKR